MPPSFDEVVVDGLDEAVVDDDVVGEVLAALGLDVVDVLHAGVLNAQAPRPRARWVAGAFDVHRRLELRLDLQLGLGAG